MVLPELPAINENPWYVKRTAFDEAVRAEIDGRLSETELNATFVQFRNFDGSAVAAGSVVVITLTEDGTDIHDITVEEA